ncbi:Cytochrome P450 52A11 [Mycena sanguinolenta]|uniref:Cytochrome P450 52A11 n=1 Tax=Mycena sanguinolenta TaxID=230812 RepID=A0A8H6YXY2_9AGAR|nr:Cytochrome P450 52A11 [Mycena sanguinolenta]
MLAPAPLFVAAGVLVASYLYRKLYYKRLKQYANFPQHPPGLVLGHLGTVDEYVRRQPPKAHIDMAFAAMRDALGRPSVMFMDLRPLSSCMVAVGSYEVAEQIISSQLPYSPGKVPEVWKLLEHLAGPRSILSAKGEEWKALRKRFNPGFAPQHLLTLLPSILDKVSQFLEHLDTYARTGEEFSLQSRATDLTFDIIGRVALDFDMDAQTDNPTEFMRQYRALIETYLTEHLDLPWWCTPLTQWKRRNLSKWVRHSLRRMIHERHSEGLSSRSILSMSLQGIDTLTPDVVDVTCDQISSFLFAGHDTTSTLMSWALYELSRTPHALSAVRAESDSLFGPDSSPDAVRECLLAPGGEGLLNRMPYTSAVIKETLRLWPPAGTSRMSMPGEGLTIRTPEGADLCLDGMIVYQVHSIIQRDPAVFGDTADRFVPERWLQGADEKIPTGAFRAFERGPRNCMGQELANIEARVLLALAVRRYDFVKVGTGAPVLDDAERPILNEHGQYQVTSEMYQTRQVTSKPIDGMMMEVRFA